MTRYQSALELLAVHPTWKLFPIVEKDSSERGEHKRPACKSWKRDATNDPDALGLLFMENENFNLGLNCSDSGVLVIDVDPRNGGLETFEALIKELGDLPEYSLRSTTGGGGFHYFFNSPGNLQCNGKLGPGVDIKHNGYVILPPSKIFGHDLVYQWVLNGEKGRGDLVDLPTQWTDKILKHHEQRPAEEPIQEYNPTTELSPYMVKAIAKGANELLSCVEGERNEKLNRISYGLYRYVPTGACSVFDINTPLLRAAYVIGLEEKEAIATLRSSYRSAIKKPKNQPATKQQKQRELEAEEKEAVIRFNGQEDAPLDYNPETGEVIEAKEDNSWFSLLSRNKKTDKIIISSGNAAIIIMNSGVLKGCLGFNTRTGAHTWVKNPDIHGVEGCPRPLKDTDFSWLARWIESIEGRHWPVSIVTAGAIAACESNEFDDVEQYLRGLVWDGKKRLDRLATDIFGAEDSPGPNLMFRKWLIQCVARTMTPGCQADHVLTLEGAQGIGKSTSLKILGGKWYQANLSDVSSTNAIHDLQSSFVVEIGELDSLRGVNSSRIKDFISRRSDTFRRPYERLSKTVPRRCCFAATTNESAYLEDNTGNRRFWPIQCGVIDRDTLTEIRDQLWAEAVHAYDNEEPWWLTAEEEKAFAVKEQEAREIIDPWAIVLEEKIKDADEFDMNFALEVLEIPIERRGKREQRRIGSILKNMGYKKTRERRRGLDGRLSPKRFWKKE